MVARGVPQKTAEGEGCLPGNARHYSSLSPGDPNRAPQKRRYVLIVSESDGFALALTWLTFARRAFVLVR
jgi:hypothetical protein